MCSNSIPWFGYTFARPPSDRFGLRSTPRRHEQVQASPGMTVGLTLLWAVGPAQSLTWTLKLLVAATVGGPEIAVSYTVYWDARERPAGSEPETSVHVYRQVPAVPPVETI